jgi:hypothetical protein
MPLGTPGGDPAHPERGAVDPGCADLLGHDPVVAEVVDPTAAHRLGRDEA